MKDSSWNLICIQHFQLGNYLDPFSNFASKKSVVANLHTVQAIYVQAQLW